MSFIFKRSLLLLSLLLVSKYDQALSFGLGGISATESCRHAESSSAFARSGARKNLSTTRNQPTATIRPRKPTANFQLNAVMDIVGVSPEPIHTAFAFATFGPQPFWLLIILLPGNELTKNIMGKMGKCFGTRSLRPLQECLPCALSLSLGCVGRSWKREMVLFA